MLDLETIDRRIRICTVLLEKKKEQYHTSVLRGDDANKQRKLRKQCRDLCGAISRLDELRKNLGGVTDGKTD